MESGSKSQGVQNCWQHPPFTWQCYNIFRKSAAALGWTQTKIFCSVLLIWSHKIAVTVFEFGQHDQVLQLFQIKLKIYAQNRMSPPLRNTSGKMTKLHRPLFRYISNTREWRYKLDAYADRYQLTSPYLQCYIYCTYDLYRTNLGL